MDLDILNILSDYIGNKPTTMRALSKDTLALAQSHQVVPILYYQTKDKTLYQSYLQAISTYTQRQQLLSQITEALTDIPFYTVKGVALAQYYPIPQLRTMGDSDIIVHENDKERAREILLSIGFKDTTGEWDDMEWHFQKQGLDFELHHRLLYDEAVNTEQEKAFADTAWDYVQNHELDSNFHFAYLLLHLKKHLLNRGVGIRQFMDLAVMSKNAGLEPETLKVFLQQAGIERFAGVCSALCLRWFDIALPVDTPEISDAFYQSATDTILSNGVFGFEVPVDEQKLLLNHVKKKGKAHLIITHLFPSYKICCITPKYKWIKGKPFLMPVLWIYRCLWALFSGRSKSSAEYISSVAVSDKAMAKRDQDLAEWGL